MNLSPSRLPPKAESAPDKCFPGDVSVPWVSVENILAFTVDFRAPFRFFCGMGHGNNRIRVDTISKNALERELGAELKLPRRIGVAQKLAKIHES